MVSDADLTIRSMLRSSVRTQGFTKYLDGTSVETRQLNGNYEAAVDTKDAVNNS